jgi:hypothetical protein
MSRGARHCLALGLLSGCLAAPPDSTGEDLLPDDGTLPCASLAKNDFLDDDTWFSNATGSGELDLFADHVEIYIESDDEPGFVELTTNQARPIEGTRVEATLAVDQSDAGNVSIAFDGTSSGGGYYEIAIADGVVQSLRQDGEALDLLCGAVCPGYEPELHQRFRLRAGQDRVYYESWDGDLWTQLVPSVTGSPGNFTVSLKAFGVVPEGMIDALLSDLTWQECGE